MSRLSHSVGQRLARASSRPTKAITELGRTAAPAVVCGEQQLPPQFGEIGTIAGGASPLSAGRRDSVATVKPNSRRSHDAAY